MYEGDRGGIYKIVDENNNVYYEVVENVSQAVLYRRRQILNNDLDVPELKGACNLTVEELYITDINESRIMLDLLIATQTALGRSLNKPVKKIIKLSQEQKILFTTKEETGMSEEQKRKISKTLMGTKKSEETRRKISKAMKGRTYPTVKCPHCGKEGKGGAMTRYHFNNCKEKANGIL